MSLHPTKTLSNFLRYTIFNLKALEYNFLIRMADERLVPSPEGTKDKDSRNVLTFGSLIYLNAD